MKPISLLIFLLGTWTSLFSFSSVDLFLEKNEYPKTSTVNGVSVNIKVFLEGPYENGKMKDGLRTNSLLPTTEPHSSLSFFLGNSSGGESTSSNVFNITGDNAIVDWVLVELRSASDANIILYTRSGLLQKDGDVVDVDGFSALNFPNASSGNYFIAVRHRNHLGIMTNNVVNLGTNTITIDFTLGSTATYGSNARNQINGVYMMICGDANRSGKVDAVDRNENWNERNSFGYALADVDLSGTVDASDRSKSWNNREKVEQLPTGGSGNADLTITVTFASFLQSTPSVSFSTLKYNKNFAYSLTFDDGSVFEHKNALPILGGGTISNGQSQPGHFYTDGCGNNQEFRAAIAINGYHIQDVTNGQNYMSWDEVKDIYNADWDILNHSYKHCYGSSCDYAAEILNNVNKIQEKLGFTPNHFAVPTGDNEGYTDPAFANGMLAVHDQFYLFPGVGGLQVDGNVDLNNFLLHRNTLEFEPLPLGEDIDLVANNSSNGNHFWFSEYAHRIGFATDPYIFLNVNDFIPYMQHIENNYGRYGSDRVWFAPVQEVYEYIQVRQTAQLLPSSVSNNQMTIELDLSNVPNNLRRNALSMILNVQGLPTITNVQVSNGNVTYNSNGLINLSW